MSLDRRATTGAAPVPVPPPMPAVMNTCRAGQERVRGSVGECGEGVGAAQLEHWVGKQLTMSAPPTAAASCSCDSWAASSPSSGLPPVPAGGWQYGKQVHWLYWQPNVPAPLGRPVAPSFVVCVWGGRGGGVAAARAQGRPEETRTEAAGERHPDLQFVECRVALQRLGVGVHCPELHALESDQVVVGEAGETNMALQMQLRLK